MSSNMHKKYFRKYEKAKSNKSVEKTMTEKQLLWSNVIPDIENGLSEGAGYELSYVRDCMNKELGLDSKVTNKEIKILLVNHFGDKITFSRSNQATKSLMFFSKSVPIENIAETVRTSDPISQSADMIRQCLLDMNFDLQDRFCDSKDLEIAWENMVIPKPLLNFFSTFQL